MLLTIAGALTTAIVAAIAARLARERRALSADIQALRTELRALTDTMAGDRNRPGHGNAGAHAEAEPTAAHRDSVQPGRTSRTVH